MPSSTSTDWRALHGKAFENIPVLVTGGAGFIGSHLVQALNQLGAKVTVLDDLSGGSEGNLENLGPVEFIRGSILDADTVRTGVSGRQLIFHEAALGSVPGSVDQPRRYNDVNTVGTLNILEAAREARVKRVLFAASSSAYGDNPVPWIEHMPVLPKSPYAATKVAGEALFRAYSESYPTQLDTVSLRYFNIFGPRQNANSAYAAVIAAFAKSILAGQRPHIYGDGTQSRDFTFVHNAVHANLLAARSERRLAGDVINVGCGIQISVNDLAHRVAHFLNRPDLKPDHLPERAGDLKHSFADLKHARAMLNYEPVVGFEAGLEETLGWYAEVLK